MKILFVITGLGGGGAERQLVDVADKLSEKGNDVIIAHLLNNVKIRPQKENIRLVYLGLKVKNPFSLILAAYNLRKLIKKERVEVVHSHMVHANLLSRFVRLFVKIPLLVCTAHSNNEGGVVRMLLYRWSHGLCDVMTSVSQDTAIEFEKRGAVPIGGITAICNGIDVNKFVPNKEKNKKCRHKFLAVGRLVEAKDYPNLLLAFSDLSRQVPSVSLDIVGDGPLREMLESKIIELNMEHNVRLLGWREDIDKLMRIYDFFVISSSYEGFGLVVAEAMASGMPVISTDSGGVREIIGNFGYIVPISNFSALSEMLRKAIDLTDDQYETLALGGRQRIVENYSIDSTVNQWLKLYKS
ncbi:glycosyltransferase [Kerstersia gyiorum]|uniref:glycosyltransferase n=1 Tax=Kerstersia gyiorum TaxID=206506 RepID=UPI003B434B6B